MVLRSLSIRTRVIACFVASSCALLIVFSAAVYAYVRSHLHESVDKGLREKAASLVALSDWDEHAMAVEYELDEDLAERLSTGSPEVSAQLFEVPSGRCYFAQGGQIDRPAPSFGEVRQAELEAKPLTIFQSDNGAESALRICNLLAYTPADPEEIDALPFTVLARVQQDLAPVEAKLATLWKRMLTFVALVAAILIALGFWLARTVVSPLQHLGECALQLRAGEPITLPNRGAHDEVDQLSELLQSAFDRLAEALHRQARFTSDAAHELRNPIAIVQNAAEVGLRRDRSPEEYRAFLTDILITANRMSRVIDALLLLARMDKRAGEGNFEQVDLSDLATETAAAHADAAARLSVQAHDAAWVTGDRALLRVLIDNLVSNALRYSAEDAAVRITVTNHGAEVELAVSDEGPGIPEHALGRVFDRFYRVDSCVERTDGAGLGLALVAEVAHAHSVQAQVETSEQGTTFRVRFPLARSAA